MSAFAQKIFHFSVVAFNAGKDYSDMQTAMSAVQQDFETKNYLLTKF